MVTIHEPDHDAPTVAPTERAAAGKHIEARRTFAAHVVAYLVVNGFLVFLWAFTTAGYFWPGWVMAGWAAVLLLHAWDSFVRRLVSEDNVDLPLPARRMTATRRGGAR